MKIKTIDLDGDALDWAVGIAQSPNSALWYLMTNGICKFSRDWAQGGPIIESEGISIETLTLRIDKRTDREAIIERVWVAKYSYAVVSHRGDFRSYFRSVGPVPLIAGMRCYVLRKLGHEVEIPDVFCK
ncbi:MAG: phage protein NinX family protein [Burkholderiales bacterium]|jgi:hypothetical protein